MNLATYLDLQAGGVGSGCNPADGKCGRPSGEIKNREDLKKALSWLSDKLGVKMPNYQWSDKGNPEYDVSKRRITSGPHAYLDDPDEEKILSVLHEMAHHVEGPTPAEGSGSRGGLEHDHGKSFQKALDKVAQAWYGNAKKYPWAIEGAKGVVKYAYNRGYISRGTFQRKMKEFAEEDEVFG